MNIIHCLLFFNDCFVYLFLRVKLEILSVLNLWNLFILSLLRYLLSYLKSATLLVWLVTHWSIDIFDYLALIVSSLIYHLRIIKSSMSQTLIERSERFMNFKIMVLLEPVIELLIRICHLRIRSYRTLWLTFSLFT